MEFRNLLLARVTIAEKSLPVPPVSCVNSQHTCTHRALRDGVGVAT